MKRAVVSVCLLVGCGFSGSPAADDASDTQPDDAGPADDTPADDAPTDDGTPTPDAAIDALADAAVDAAPMIDAPPPQFCIGTGIGRTCFDTEPTTAITLPATINTGECATVMTVAGVQACVLAGSRIEMNTNVRVTGTRPLVLLSATTIVVDFVLAASSRNETIPTFVGPGSPGAACGAGGAPGANGAGSGGGPGGSFVGQGGSGGTGAAGNTAGGTAAGPETNLAFHAGCPGRDGGNSPGSGGAGGGAIYLAANGSIDIQLAGQITAGGAGGIAGGPRDGGGGAGSGGFIGLDAPLVTGSGVLMAPGGGGGEGGGDTISGASGEDGRFETSFARGGAGADNGGDGGRGNSPSSGAGNGGPGNRGGGGGGGGAGRIYIHQPAGTDSYVGEANPSPTRM